MSKKEHPQQSEYPTHHSSEAAFKKRPIIERIIYITSTQQSEKKKIPKQAQHIFNTAEGIEEQTETVFEKNIARRAILLSSMWKSPEHFTAVAAALQIPSELSWTLVREAHEDEETKKLADVIFQKIDEKKKATFYDTFHKIISEGFSDILPEKQLGIIELNMQGKSPHEIADILSMKHSTVEDNLTKARKTIESQKFYPIGIKRVASYNRPKLRTAAYVGSLDSVRFLRYNYTNDTAVNQYMKKARNLDAQMIAKGHVPLSELVQNGTITHNEYDLFRAWKKYSPYVKRKDGIVYMNPKDIEMCRTLKRKP